MTEHRTVVGSYNLYQRSDDHAADRAVRTFAPLVDVGGLQEYGGAARRESLAALAELGVDFFKPKDCPTAPPIIWHRDRYSFVDGHSPLVADGRRVLPVPGKRAVLEDLHASVVELRDLVTGKTTRIGNVHMPAHVEFWPGPRRAMYRETLAALRPMRLDYLTGDFNWSLNRPDVLPRQVLQKAGLLCCWAGNPTRDKSEGGRLIDGVFARERAAGARVLTSFHVGDHKPVIATYSKEHRRG